MAHWLYPANPKLYDVLTAFAAPETYWPISSKVSVGDIIYIYLAAPYKQLGFVCEVSDININKQEVMDVLRPLMKPQKAPPKRDKVFMKLQVCSRMSLEETTLLDYQSLKDNGLNGMLMGPRRLENNPALLNYIHKVLYATTV
ncbi:MAG: hypothetical protein AAF708_06460 [Deinococcota bacterium]